MSTHHRLPTSGLKGLVLGVALAAASSAAAFAAPVTFTWAPNAVLGGGLTNIGPATNVNVNDFANIDVLTGGATFTEHGYLTVLSFLDGGDPAPSVGLASTYSLYFGFNGGGAVGGAIPTMAGNAITGAFSSLNYTLYAVLGGQPSVSIAPGSDPTLTAAGTPVPVAYGSLIGGFDTLTKTTNGYSPTANLDLSLHACTAAGQGNTGFGNVLCTANESGFFLSPLPSDIRLLVGNFSATDSVTTVTPGPLNDGAANISINGGGGNLTIATPEPASMVLFGTGLLGLAVFARRRAQKGN